MDVQLKELIDRINSEGVERAEQKAREITQAAENQAADIVDRARREASEIVSKARTEAASFEASSREALKQAGRDLILKVQQQVIDLFKSIVTRETRQALTGKVLEESIVALVTGWRERGEIDLEVLLPPEQGEKVQQALLSRLAQEVRRGLKIELLPGIAAGFRVTEKGGSVYYDFTDEGIADFLIAYLNPKLSAIMRQAAGRES